MKKILTALCITVMLLCTGCSFGEKLQGKFSGYTAESEFLITNGGITNNDGSVNNTDIAASVNMLPTIRAIVRSEDFLTNMHKEMEIDIAYEDFKKAISITQPEKNSLIIQITVKASTQETADAILECLQENLPEYVENKVPGIRIEW